MIARRSATLIASVVAVFWLLAAPASAGNYPPSGTGDTEVEGVKTGVLDGGVLDSGLLDGGLLGHASTLPRPAHRLPPDRAPHSPAPASFPPARPLVTPRLDPMTATGASTARSPVRAAARTPDLRGKETP